MGCGNDTDAAECGVSSTCNDSYSMEATFWMNVTNITQDLVDYVVCKIGYDTLSNRGYLTLDRRCNKEVSTFLTTASIGYESKTASNSAKLICP